MAAVEGLTSGGELPRKYVRIPDMFASIMSVAPRVNPHYHKVKQEAEKWAISVLSLDEQQAMKCSMADVTYLAALWVPDADEEALRVFADWMHWVFYFDDQFDEGHLKDDPEAAKEEILATLATMDDGHPVVAASDNPLRYVFQYTWLCFQKRASPDLQKRYKKSIEDYFDGVLRQVDIASGSTTVGVEEFMHSRRSAIGVYPAQDLAEYARGIELPTHVFDDKAVMELRRISSDITCLQNDILSYRKDLAEGTEHNIIHVYRKQGLSEQQAVDAVDGMFNGLYKHWYLALAEIAPWGEQVDREMLKYIDCCRDVALGNLYWSFETGRYLGKEGETVHRTRMMAVP
ncbi:terpene synthase metal binding domain protein [Diplodia corticola]|uniref:Terpene synthase n=1 Tax=Diplodia corticola TaxID=236234 RepID=A0A1J9S814_9PEZI|nr:terpene synthase metal binding domain protein [Diplodia corticola]OJD36052.1 terpene synthase metal binding domain protein [Diplodia corticola]